MRRTTAFLAATLLSMTPVFAGTPTPRWETLPPSQPLPAMARQGYVERDHARIWYGVIGNGKPVLLLHGGMASSQGWGDQVAALLRDHRQVILVDSRGHGRSTLGDQPLGYERMEADVIAVLDTLGVKRTDVVGWSDGANISLILAMKHPQRAGAIYAFGANMNTDATKPDAFSAPILKAVVERLAGDYAHLSSTPDGFGKLHEAVEAMQKVEPNYPKERLAAIHGPRIAIVDGDHDEFIKDEHTAYLARTIPGATLIVLPGVSHFAPWQAPGEFNASLLGFLDQPGR